MSIYIVKTDFYCNISGNMSDVQYVTIFYIKPRELFQKLKKKGIKRFFMEDFLGSGDSPRKKALSIALAQRALEIMELPPIPIPTQDPSTENQQPKDYANNCTS